MSADRFTIRYELDDGYAGGARPQDFDVTSDIFEEGMTDDQITELLYDLAVEDMRQRIGISVRNEPDFIKWAREKIGAEPEVSGDR